eukprot:6182767-Pleurochrysis_carterae.AAC.4
MVNFLAVPAGPLRPASQTCSIRLTLCDAPRPSHTSVAPSGCRRLHLPSDARRTVRRAICPSCRSAIRMRTLRLAGAEQRMCVSEVLRLKQLRGGTDVFLWVHACTDARSFCSFARTGSLVQSLHTRNQPPPLSRRRAGQLTGTCEAPRDSRLHHWRPQQPPMFHNCRSGVGACGRRGRKKGGESRGRPTRRSGWPAAGALTRVRCDGFSVCEQAMRRRAPPLRQ